ncbi:MAG: N-acetylmuramoyl-L-alanine amidase [Mangrovibacterium sp.]
MKKLALFLISTLILNFLIFAQENPSFVAKNGDTIYSILRKNKLSPSKHMASFIELNKGKLTKDNGLIIGRTYLIPIDETTNSTPDSTSAEQTIIEEQKAAAQLEIATQQAVEVETPVEYRTFVAKNGDGISIVLTKYGLKPSKHTAEFIELNKKNIGKNNDLFIGVEYKLPNDSEVKTTIASNTETSSAKPKEEAAPKVEAIKKLSTSIYGANYSNFAQVSNKLQGAIYYLISGHGGPDPGARGIYNNTSIYEDEYAYDVTLRLARELEANGAKVYLIIRDKNDGIRDDIYLPADKDEVCYPNQEIPLNQVKRLTQRSEAVNELYKQNKGNFQRCIITHIDSRGKNTPIDAFFYYDERSTGGKQMAQILYKTFNSKYQTRTSPREYHGTVSTRNLFVLRNTLPVAVFIELGNINYYRDIQRIVLKDNRQALANWLCEGLIVDYQQNKNNK